AGPARMVADAREGVELRWRPACAFEVALGELSAAFGEPVMHHLVAELLNVYRAKVLDLHQALVAISEPFPLPGPNDDDLAKARDWAKLSELEPKETGPLPPGWLAEREQAELERLQASRALPWR